TFTQNDSSGGSTEVATGTTLTYAGSPALTVGQPIDINGGAPVTQIELTTTGVPITFPDEPSLSITLNSFGPGSSTACSSAITIGESCSPELSSSPVILSPIILTETATGTSAALAVGGTAKDGSGISDVTGNFSATITGETPEELSSLSSYTTTSSGTFVITSMSPVPEPRSISLVLLAGLLMGIVVMRRKKIEA
ncbi:MAG: PEP-CTERM sorting domain-containing protein, partial [Candidatus Sulfotelmatobacter sp.]